ncbi:hypothetical protein [Sinorhizobium fredii]|uniref:hypothetical protein n=1 Tax=Rhizobium fredii TaxID=380 RepID=UPI0004B50BDD|nr:hypothetical protein [Sinorhizobium fredii]ASY69741.1 hypothetical protein SF83666_c23250 [Sinorhizobium fredii CCBAU 83666]
MSNDWTTVIPHQDYVTLQVVEDVVNITQEGYSEGDQTISIMGRANMDLFIAALQKAREEMA